jgi:hypothetical protein
MTMSLANLKTDSTIKDETDSVGGNGPVESGLYPHKITMAFFGKSSGGAMSLDLHLADPDGKELRQTIYITSGDAKGNKNYYEDKAGAKAYLPGFNVANSLALLTVGKEIGEIETEEKTVKLYSFVEKAEVLTKVPMLMELLGQEVLTGVIRQTVDKNVKDEATGKYVPTGETRQENEIDKFFRAADRMTTAEIRAQAAVATFADTWEAKWKGVDKDKSTKGASAPAATGAGNTAKPTSSLFSVPAA